MKTARIFSQSHRFSFILAFVLIIGFFLVDEAIGGDASNSSAFSSLQPTGVWWLGFLFGYFLVYSINVGSNAGDALKSLVGVLGIGSGGLLALFPSPSGNVDAATTIANVATKLGFKPATAGQATAPQLPQDFTQNIVDALQKVAQATTTNQMNILTSYVYGAITGFIVYIVLTLVLASAFSLLYNPKDSKKEDSKAVLLAETLAKTLLGEDFKVGAGSAAESHS